MNESQIPKPSENLPKLRNKKILENPFLASAVVPIAVVLTAIVIVMGLTKLLTIEKDYHNLVEEMSSKTFGNRWVAAFELSKVLANQKVPRDEIPWLVDNLKKIYIENQDPRTKNFIILALTSLPIEFLNNSLSFFETALEDSDAQVRFNALVAIGNYPSGTFKNYSSVLNNLNSNDLGLVQASIFVLAHHKIQAAVPKLRDLVNSKELSTKYAAATALIAFKDEACLPVLKEILTQDNLGEKFNSEQTQNLKLRVVDALRSYHWESLNSELKSVAENGTNLKLSTRAQEVLNFFKN